MAEPFRTTPERKGGLGSVMRSKRAATFEAIENLLAKSDNVRDISEDAVAAICEAHTVDISRKFASDRKALYRRYLAYCLDDKVLTDEENADLVHLRSLLHLTRADVAAIHDDVARDVYGKAIEEVLEDLEIDEEEEAFLQRLRDDLHMPEKMADKLLAHGQLHARERALIRASAPDLDFVFHRESAGEFTGRSDDTLEAAIADALEKASVAVPDLYWFEVIRLAGYVGEGKPKGWHITVRCGIAPRGETSQPSNQA